MVNLTYYSMGVFIMWILLARMMNSRIKQQASSLQGYGTRFTFGELLVSLIGALVWPIVMLVYIALLMDKDLEEA